MSAVVYRVFDATGELLYIGSTTDLAQRIYNHLHNRFSCGESVALRERIHSVEGEEFPTLEEARAAERLAIRAEAPLLNKHHNPTRWRQGPGHSWLRVGAVAA